MYSKTKHTGRTRTCNHFDNSGDHSFNSSDETDYHRKIWVCPGLRGEMPSDKISPSPFCRYVIQQHARTTLCKPKLGRISSGFHDTHAGIPASASAAFPDLVSPPPTRDPKYTCRHSRSTTTTPDPSHLVLELEHGTGDRRLPLQHNSRLDHPLRVGGGKLCVTKFRKM